MRKLGSHSLFSERQNTCLIKHLVAVSKFYRRKRFANCVYFGERIVFFLIFISTWTILR